MGFGRSRTFRRVAAVAAFQMAFLGLASNLLFLAAFRFRFGWVAEPELAVAGGTTSAELLRWAALTDATGYYVPMVPIAVVWWVELRPRRPLLMDLGAAGAILFAVAGGTAAVVLAIQGSSLIERYAQEGDAAVAAARDFRALVDVVFRTCWQGICLLAIGSWFLSAGTVMRRSATGLVARMTVLLGITASLGAVANAAGLDSFRDGLVALLLGAWLIWAFLVGRLLWHTAPGGAT